MLPEGGEGVGASRGPQAAPPSCPFLSEEPPSTCRRFTELRTIAKGPCALPDVEVSYCAGRCRSRTTVTAEVSRRRGRREQGGGGGSPRFFPRHNHASFGQEPYLQSLCECCSYRLDPASPIRILRLPCPGGHTEPVVLPVIRSCQCSSCQGK